MSEGAGTVSSGNGRAQAGEAVLGPYSVAGRSCFVTIEPAAAALREAVEAALSPFASNGLHLDGDRTGSCEARFRVDRTADGFVLARKRTPLREALEPDEVLPRLFEQLDEVARSSCARRLLGCPGAVVARDGHAAVLIGARDEAEARAADLVAEGFALVSAGWVLLDPDGALVAHPRPLVDGTAAGDAGEVTPRLVLLLGAEVDGPAALGATEGVAEMLVRSDEVARSGAALAASVPLARDAAFVAVPAGAAVAPAEVRSLLAAPPSSAGPAPSVQRGARDGVGGSVEVAERVVTLQLPDGALVHDPRTGGLHRLDASAAVLWDALLDGLDEDAIRAELAPQVPPTEHEHVAATIAAFYRWAHEEGLLVATVGSRP